MPGNELRTVRVWDLPTRLFHWTLALCALGLFVTGKIGGEAMPWHARLGYTVGSLLLFRVAWGVVGGHWSRFASFTHSPRVILNYLRGRPAAELPIGHSPLGSASVYALHCPEIAAPFIGPFIAPGPQPVQMSSPRRPSS